MVEDKSGERASAGRRLIIGGARSGKTAHAIALAKSLSAAQGADVTYVATAQPLDEEMQHRISLHRAERPATWRTLEAPAGLAQALRARRESGDPGHRLHDTVAVERVVTRIFARMRRPRALPTWEAERDRISAMAASSSRRCAVDFQ